MSTPAAFPRRRPGGLAAPAVLGLPATVGLAFLVLPLLAVVLRAPWRRLPSLLAAPTVGPALRLSLVAATAATVLSLVTGVPLAWLLARVPFPGRRVLRSLVTLPLVLPPVVGGLALLDLLGRRGLLGPALSAAGVSVPFTTVAVVLAETFVAMPFLVVTVEGALAGADRRVEEAAATLGAGTWTTFRRVTLPLVGPSVVAGAVLCFARALGEFGATITFAGNLPGTTQTMPLAVYTALQTDPDAAVALALVLLAVSIVLLVALRGRWVTRATGS